MAQIQVLTSSSDRLDKYGQGETDYMVNIFPPIRGALTVRCNEVIIPPLSSELLLDPSRLKFISSNGIFFEDLDDKYSALSGEYYFTGGIFDDINDLISTLNQMFREEGTFPDGKAKPKGPPIQFRYDPTERRVSMMFVNFSQNPEGEEAYLIDIANAYCDSNANITQEGQWSFRAGEYLGFNYVDGETTGTSMIWDGMLYPGTDFSRAFIYGAKTPKIVNTIDTVYVCLSLPDVDDSSPPLALSTPELSGYRVIKRVKTNYNPGIVSAIEINEMDQIVWSLGSPISDITQMHITLIAFSSVENSWVILNTHGKPVHVGFVFSLT